MFFKSRRESKELIIFSLLNTRMDLSQNERQQYCNLKKGYEGERRFDSLTECLSDKFLILNDLQLESNSSLFQMDTLLITQDILIPCEIKNYEGDYIYENDNFYKCTTKREITNPLHQLNRIETLLRQFLQKHGYPFAIKGFLTFINPKFFLYQAPQNEKMIFWPQWGNFLKYLHEQPSRLNKHHHKLAKFLVESHHHDPPYSKLPPYQYELLRKGILCPKCFSFMSNHTQRKVICEQCGQSETMESAVVRSVEEFKILFPEKEISTDQVYDWCKIIQSKRIIGRILKKNFKMLGYGQWTFYE